MDFNYQDGNKNILSSVSTTQEFVTIPSSVTSVYSNFLNNSGECIKIIVFEENSNLESLYENCFSHSSSIKTIDLSSCKRLENLSNWCFSYSTNLETVKLPIGGMLSHFNPGSFSNCFSIESIFIPNTVVSFADCIYTNAMNTSAVSYSGTFDTAKGLKYLIFEENSQLKYIGGYCFVRCESLKTIILPKSVELIMNRAFSSVYYTKLTILSRSITIYSDNILSDAHFIVLSKKVYETLVKHGVKRSRITLYSTQMTSQRCSRPHGPLKNIACTCSPNFSSMEEVIIGNNTYSKANAIINNNKH